MKVACETYVWEMLGSDWRGTPEQLMDYVAEAGYEGIEFTTTMLGRYLDRPKEFANELDKRGLKFCCLAFGTPSSVTEPNQGDADLEVARQAIAFLTHFPSAQLEPGTANHANPQQNWQRKVDHAIAFYNKVGGLASRSSIAVCVHPNSGDQSLLKTAEQYRYLMQRLDPWVKYCPDSGHIVRGGQDLISCFREHIKRISHVHLKDVDADGNWKLTGEGICDFRGIMGLLQSNGYDGWIVLEDESDEARRDGRAAIRHGREYFRKLMAICGDPSKVR